MIGRIVGNYRIAEKIGEGGMGAVYRAVDLMLEREVALKAIRPELSREPQIVERFRSEARSLARVSHPSIANVYAFFYEEDELFLALELVRGRTLSRVLEAGGAIPWQRAVQLLASAMEGIEQAHRTGIVHRDLKPDNLMLTEAGTLKVMDFGIARVMGSGHLTRTGLLVGTLRYMSPEQIRGEEVDGRTDVYALGAVLYEMLTGRTPFEGTSDWAILRAQMEDTPRPPGEQVPLLPWWLDRAVLKALSKQPAERFQSVEEMRVCLLRQGETMPSARPAAPPASIEDLPTLVTPAGAARPAAFIPPPLEPAAGHTTIASPPAGPGSPAPTSYRPVELGRKIMIGGGALLAFLVLAAAGVWLLTSVLGPRNQAAGGKPAAAAAQPTPAVSQEPVAAAPSTELAAMPPVPVPRSAPPLPRPAPRKPEPAPVETGTAQPATTPAVTAEPQEPEPPDAPNTGEEAPPSTGQDAFEELHTLASELDTKSGELVDKYKEFLGKKEDGGSPPTQSDEKLKDDLEAFQDAAVTLDKQFQVGRWGRLFGHKADDRRKTRQNFRQLAALGVQVEALIREVHPGPEVHRAWAEVRRRWKRVGAIVAGL